MVPPRKYSLRAALPTSLLRLAGVRGEVQILEEITEGFTDAAEEEEEAVIQSLRQKQEAYAKTRLLFEKLEHESVLRTEGGREVVCMIREFVMKTGRMKSETLFVDGVGGGGKTSALLLAWASLLAAWEEGNDDDDDDFPFFVPLCSLATTGGSVVHYLVRSLDLSIVQLRRLKSKKRMVFLFAHFFQLGLSVTFYWGIVCEPLRTVSMRLPAFELSAP